MAEYWPACQEAVLNCFPDMCPEYLIILARDWNWDYEQIITSVLDQQEKGQSYPTQPNTSKRKRADTRTEAPDAKDMFEKDDARLATKDATFIRQYTRTA